MSTSLYHAQKDYLDNVRESQRSYHPIHRKIRTPQTTNLYSIKRGTLRELDIALTKWLRNRGQDA